MKTRILQYDEIKGVSLGDSQEELVRADAYDPTIHCEYKKFDMVAYTGFDIMVRETVAWKLALANAMLSESGLRLKVVYGYRAREVQQSYFDKRSAAILKSNPTIGNEELRRLTHNFVAVPDAAGHTLGAAVDVTLVDGSGNELDMGTEIANYTIPEKIQTMARNITEEQAANRRVLLQVMYEQGFAPFFGEWWHFSYGDKEWAVYYGLNQTLYSPVDMRTTAKTCTIAGGNKTVLQVVDTWRGSSVNAEAAQSLMNLARGIDQAGIFYRDINKLVMAGGEFCGNASAATAALVVDNGKCRFSVSGLGGGVYARCRSSDAGTIWVSLLFEGINYQMRSVKLDGGSVQVVRFDGIEHVLILSDFPTDYLLQAKSIITKLRLTTSEAVGVVWCSRVGASSIRIDPVVWVRGIDTMFYESSCGSGSMAAAMAFGVGTVTQPTNRSIEVVIAQGCIITKSEVVIERQHN